MSQLNGDKARFGRERKRKVIRRMHLRDFRKAPEGKTPELTAAASGQDSAALLALQPIETGQ